MDMDSSGVIVGEGSIRGLSGNGKQFSEKKHIIKEYLHEISMFFFKRKKK